MVDHISELQEGMIAQDTNSGLHYVVVGTYDNPEIPHETKFPFDPFADLARLYEPEALDEAVLADSVTVSIYDSGFCRYDPLDAQEYKGWKYRTEDGIVAIG